MSNNQEICEAALILCQITRPKSKFGYIVLPIEGMVIGPRGILGESQNSYKIITIYNHTVYLHRFIWFYCYGLIPKNMEIDHIDRNVSNNSIYNLRLVTRSQNRINRVFK